MEQIIELAAVVTVVLLAALWLKARLGSLASPLRALQTEYKDALTLISRRADKSEKLLEVALETIAAFERAVGDKKANEHALQSERVQCDYLRERLSEIQRAVIGLANPKVEATVVGQTRREKEPAEAPYQQPLTRWQAADGIRGYGQPTSSTFKGPSDLAGQVRRESGPTFLLPQPDDDAF